MPKMIVAIDGVVIKEVALLKERMTLGRRPYNDIVIDNLAVSGEHALVRWTTDGVELEDLGSTNGTYVNGKAIKQQKLRHGDAIDIGKCKIRFEDDGRAAIVPPAPVVAPRVAAPVAPVPAAPAAVAAQPAARPASIKVLTGPAAGREVPLTKPVTRIGKPGVAVAAISKVGNGYVVHHADGAGQATLNQRPFGSEPVPLKHGDEIELADTRIVFTQA